jgi:hypothetical protein
MGTKRFFSDNGPSLAPNVIFPEISVEEGCNFVNRTIIATTLFLGISLAAPADGAAYTEQGRQATGTMAGDDRSVRTVDVLHSEELPVAPIYYHLVRSAMMITSAGNPAFGTTVEKLIPWQVPPPRQRQRSRLRSDPANPIPFAFH